MKVLSKEERRAAYPLVLVFVLLVAGIVATGCLYYRHYEQHFRIAAERQLTTIAALKVDGLAQYRKERLEDASIFFNNTAFSGLVRRFFDHPEDVDARRQIQEWMVKCSATDQYNLSCLLDVQGVTRLSSSAGLPPVSSAVLRRIPEILRAGQATFQDFHRNEHNQRIYLDVLIPISDEQNVGRPLGVFYLRIDPEKYLYPFIQRWPVPSETAETLLVRRDGNDVLYLNELKFQTNTALNRRISLENTNVPAVKAVLGQEGIVEGTDYRGTPVMAALRAIPDSPWFLVARVDKAEVYAPMRTRLWQVVVMVCVLLFGSAACVGWVWRHQRARFYQAKYEAEEASTKLSAIVESSEDAIISKSLDGIITSWNTGAEHIYGYSAAEAIGKPITILIPPEHSNEFPQFTEKIKRGEAIKHYETERIRKNGERIQMSLTLSPIKGETGTIVGISVIGRDITERKRAEDALEKRLVALTRPLDTPEGIKFEELFELAAIQRIQDEFAAATGVASIITHPDGTPITRISNSCRLCRDIIRCTETGRRNCYSSDAAIGRYHPDGPIVQPCLSGGLWDAGASITIGNRHIANWLIGQVRDETQGEEKMREYARTIGADEEEVIEAFREVPSMTLARFKQIAQALFTLAQQLSASAYQNIQQARFITERKKAENDLRRSETKFRTLYDSTHDAVMLLDVKGFFDCNRATLTMFGCATREEFYTKHPADLSPLVQPDGTDSLTLANQRIATALEKGSNRFEWMHKRADTGEIFPAEVLLSAMKLDGRPVLQAVVRDITERKRMEEKLRELSRAVEQSPTSIVITNPAGDIEYVNPKFVDLTGYTLAEALGKNPRILKSGEKGSEAYRELWETITAGREWRGEFHNKKKNGELYWESASISPIRDPAGHITHFLAVKEDITARKQTEAERSQLIQELKNALANVKSLSGLLPICASCKKIRDDKGYWDQVESYVQKHSEATFTHGLCPDCIRKLYPDQAEAVLGSSSKKTP